MSTCVDSTDVTDGANVTSVCLSTSRGRLTLVQRRTRHEGALAPADGAAHHGRRTL